MAPVEVKKGLVTYHYLVDHVPLIEAINNLEKSLPSKLWIVKQAVKCATTTNISANYYYDTNSNKWVLEGASNGPFPAIDGVTVVFNDRVLIKDQTDTSQNGIYVLDDVGSSNRPFKLSRATDLDENPEFTGNIIIPVLEGQANSSKTFTLTSENVDLSKRDGITFSEIFLVPGGKVEVSSTDTTADYLQNKIVAGNNIVITKQTGADGSEQLGVYTVASPTFAGITINGPISQSYGSDTQTMLLHTSDFFSDTVISGLLPATSSTLTSDISAGVAYVMGRRIVKDTTSHTYTALKDTYVDLRGDGTYIFTEVDNGADTPPVAPDSIRLAKVVTSATAITSVVDLRQMHTIFNTSGNVGIGTGTSPLSQKLVVAGNIGLKTNTDAFIGTLDTFGLSLRTNNTDRIYITNEGNVGIGTNPTNFKLQIDGNTGPNIDNTYDLGSTNYRWKSLYLGGGSLNIDQIGGTNYERLNIGYDTNNNRFQILTTTSGTGTLRPLYLTTGTNNGIIIDTSGNVGIGTTTVPSERLEVNGNIKGTNLISTSLTSGSILFAGSDGLISQDNANLFWDNTNKRLGIGTTSPSEKLDVSGNVNVNGRTTISSDVEVTDNTKGIILRSPNGTRFRIQIDDDGILTTTNLLTLGKGYFGGGYTSTYSDEIDGIEFSTETAINPSATLAVARSKLAGVNSSTRGYFGGGNTGSYSDEIDGIEFSTETAINPSATLAVARRDLAGVNSGAKGYFGGGYTGSYSDEIDGIEFSTETAINPSATLAVARSRLAGVNSSTRGYFGGGISTGSEIDGIEFSTETAINPSATLAVARHSLAGVNSGAKGYFGGGYTSTYSDEIDGIEFNTEAAINPSAALAVARYGLAGVNSGAKGYFGGGNTGSYSDEIDGIEFSTETAINPSATLAVARYSLAGVQSEWR